MNVRLLSDIYDRGIIIQSVFYIVPSPSPSLDAPRITNHSNDLVVVENVTGTQFFCRVDALPNATITWFFGDMSINASQNMFMNGYRLGSDSIEDDQIHYLSIETTEPSQSGTYYCVAENIVGRTNESIVLEVQGTYMCLLIFLIS